MLYIPYDVGTDQLVGTTEQTQLLQKIEELTLYILQQEEKIQQQELRIKALETEWND